MFGANDQYQQTPGAEPANPAANSSVGMPVDSSLMTVSDGNMPPFEPTSGEPGAMTGRTAVNVPEELIGIKQEALHSLKPLIGHLQQSPEEEFRLTMMMIQASDDQNLIPAAYQAAKKITDEKVRAQALLDIVNEINYFTSQNA